MRVYLTFPPERITEPVIYRLGKDFDIVTNIRRADVTATYGWVTLEREGREEDLQRGGAWLREKGVTGEQIRRYSRQLILSEVGGGGQARLLASRVMIVGAGGLGSPAALYLAAAGVGTIGLVDWDAVELSNLQRQILHDTEDVDRPKVFSAQARLSTLNPDVRVVPRQARLVKDNARELLAGYDVVVEGSDSLATKLRVNDACVALGTPLVVAGVLRWDGQLMVVRPNETACYRCAQRAEPPSGAIPTCEAAGIVGPVAGVVGSLQAVEALRLCLGLPAGAAGRILFYDGATGETTSVRVPRDPGCPACGRLTERP
jgi:adenylyltransferase/sulfurtransferase